MGELQLNGEFSQIARLIRLRTLRSAERDDLGPLAPLRCDLNGSSGCASVAFIFVYVCSTCLEEATSLAAKQGSLLYAIAMETDGKKKKKVKKLVWKIIKADPYLPSSSAEALSVWQRTYANTKKKEIQINYWTKESFKCCPSVHLTLSNYLASTPNGGLNAWDQSALTSQTLKDRGWGKTHGSECTRWVLMRWDNALAHILNAGVMCVTGGHMTAHIQIPQTCMRFLSLNWMFGLNEQHNSAWSMICK